MSYHRVVVKVGTSSLTNTKGRLDKDYMEKLSSEISRSMKAGHEVILVSSGAIAVGLEKLETRQAQPVTWDLPEKQATAAVGQGILMSAYISAFNAHQIIAAQVLLTREDLADRSRFLNARNTLTMLLAMGALPVINENDTVAVDEIKFGDNDNLAAHVAVLTDADLLIILSDVDGVYAQPPSETNGEPPALLRTIRKVDENILRIAGGSGSKRGTGGMITKLEAARIAGTAGIATVIARARRERVLEDILAGESVGTMVLPRKSVLRGRRRWIAAGSHPQGAVIVNDGAARKIRTDNVSLLAVGITEVSKRFASGDLIEVYDANGNRLARGLTNYSSEEIDLIKGRRSDEIEQVLGYKYYEEVIHRDNLVVFA